MRETFFCFLLLVAVMNTFGQKVTYTYDNAGNRTLREKSVTIRSAETVADSTAQEAPETASFDDMLSDVKITVYPNPTKGALRVDITGGEIPEETRINLYTTTGVLIRQLRDVSPTNDLDISSQPAGIYFMHIMLDADRISVWRIIKE
jgi:hypothetical protein